MRDPLRRLEIVLHDLRTVPGDNAREHWSAKAKRAKEHRALVVASLGTLMGLPAMGLLTSNRQSRQQQYLALLRESLEGMGRTSGLCVTFTRVGPRALDDDNLAASCKHLRDGVAAAFGVDDGKPWWTWKYQQRKGKKGEYAVEIVIEVRGTE